MATEDEVDGSRRRADESGSEAEVGTRAVNSCARIARAWAAVWAF